jgi:hypothetical protein
VPRDPGQEQRRGSLSSGSTRGRLLSPSFQELLQQRQRGRAQQEAPGGVQPPHSGDGAAAPERGDSSSATAPRRQQSSGRRRGQLAHHLRARSFGGSQSQPFGGSQSQPFGGPRGAPSSIEAVRGTWERGKPSAAQRAATQLSPGLRSQSYSAGQPGSESDESDESEAGSRGGFQQRLGRLRQLVTDLESPATRQLIATYTRTPRTASRHALSRGRSSSHMTRSFDDQLRSRTVLRDSSAAPDERVVSPDDGVEGASAAGRRLLKSASFNDVALRRGSGGLPFGVQQSSASVGTENDLSFQQRKAAQAAVVAALRGDPAAATASVPRGEPPPPAPPSDWTSMAAATSDTETETCTGTDSRSRHRGDGSRHDSPRSASWGEPVPASSTAQRARNQRFVSFSLRERSADDSCSDSDVAKPRRTHVDMATPRQRPSKGKRGFLTNSILKDPSFTSSLRARQSLPERSADDSYSDSDAARSPHTAHDAPPRRPAGQPKGGFLANSILKDPSFTSSLRARRKGRGTE